MPHNNNAETAVVGPRPSTASGPPPPPPPLMTASFPLGSPSAVPLLVPAGPPGAPPLIHHSAHAARGVPTPNGGALYTVYVPAAHVPHQPQAHHHLPMVPTTPQPAMTVLPTTTTAAVAAAPPKSHAVPAEPPQQQHTTTVAPTSSDDETAATTKQGNRSATGSFDSQHEVAHSVLLLASGVRDDSSSKRKTSPPGSPTTAAEEDGTTKVPFKKRKMVSEILRTKDGQGTTIHVSPVSHGSKTAGTALSPDRSHGSSYEEDIKGGQALPDSAKITEDKAIVVAPPQTVTTVVRHFPSQLFDLLSCPSADVEGVLQWTTNGKAWRIVRWDALRKSVLPKHFGGATVDSFLSEISSWGFTEITHGADAGAYAHTLFRRGFPNLCKEIQQQVVAHPDKPARRNSCLSILKVPSLGDAAHIETSSKAPSSPSASTAGSAKTSKDSPVPATTTNTPTQAQAATTAWPFHAQPVYIPYRQEDHFFGTTAGDMAHPQPPPAQGWVQAIPADASGPALPAYSPVRVRSGRGAARLPAHVPVQITPNPARRTAVHRPRVVSNRGRRAGSGMVASAAMVSSATLSSLPTTMTSSSSTLVPSPLRSALKQQQEHPETAAASSPEQSPHQPSSSPPSPPQPPASPPTMEKRNSPVSCANEEEAVSTAAAATVAASS